MSESTKSTRRTKNDYVLADGTWVPGVTTVLDMRGKSEALVNWAFNIGKKNPGLRALRDYVDDLADIGSAAHDMLDAIIKDKRADLGDFTPNEIAAASNSVRKYEQWAKGKELTILATDLPLVSEDHRFGGKLDVFVSINGVPTVMDFKTGKHIWAGHIVQVVAYAELLKENILRGTIDLPMPMEVRVLQIGRTSEEGFSEQARTKWLPHWNYFLALKRAYDAEKEMEKARE